MMFFDGGYREALIANHVFICPHPFPLHFECKFKEAPHQVCRDDGMLSQDGAVAAVPFLALALFLFSS